MRATGLHPPFPKRLMKQTDRTFQVDCVPEDDCSHYQVASAGSVTLIFECPITQFQERTQDRSRLRITTHSNVELKCYVRSWNPKKSRKPIVSEKEFYGNPPYNRHITPGAADRYPRGTAAARGGVAACRLRLISEYPPGSPITRSLHWSARSATADRGSMANFFVGSINPKNVNGGGRKSRRSAHA